MFIKSGFICSLVCVIFCHAQNYKIQELSIIADNSTPHSINSNGDVIGITTKGKKKNTFLWTSKSGLSILKDIPEDAYPIKINKQGQIVGNFYSWDGWWSPKQVLHGFMWSEKTGFKDLGSIDDKNTGAISIDDEGNILLVTEDDQLYIYQEGRITLLPGGERVRQVENVVPVMNNKGQIAFVQKNVGGRDQGMLLNWRSGEIRQFLGVRKGVPYILDINDLGDVAGVFLHNQKIEGFIAKTDGSLTTISNFTPFRINNDGVAVGFHRGEDFSVSACEVFMDGEVKDIEDLLSSAEQHNQVVNLRGVNEAGWMVAEIDFGYATHAAILIPAIE